MAGNNKQEEEEADNEDEARRAILTKRVVMVLDIGRDRQGELETARPYRQIDNGEPLDEIIKKSKIVA